MVYSRREKSVLIGPKFLISALIGWISCLVYSEQVDDRCIVCHIVHVEEENLVLVLLGHCLYLMISVVDRQRFNCKTDPNPTFYFNADPDLDPAPTVYGYRYAYVQSTTNWTILKYKICKII